MISTQKFKTKTILQPRQNPSVNGWWGISVDTGYSAVKTFSPNTIASFPSYAKQVPYGTADHPIGGLEKQCIAYRDEVGNEFFVGAIAQDATKVGDSDSSTATLHSRHRYPTLEFLVISRVGLALGMMKNTYGSPAGKKLHVQIGLPPEYIKSDSKVIKNVFAGIHKFSLKLGSNDWINFAFEILPENIEIMPQPMGSLVSIATDRNGGQVPEAKKYFSSNLIIFDPGFGTLDTFDIQNHYVSSSKTWNDLGMKRVLQETCDIISKEYNTYIQVPAMQKLLGDGSFKTEFDPVTRKREIVPFADILERANKKVCEEALNVLDSYYNYLQDHDYLVVTGGTGAAWYDMIVDHYKGIEGLKIIRANINDNIPDIFNNVRGYYMTQLNNLKRR